MIRKEKQVNKWKHGKWTREMKNHKRVSTKNGSYKLASMKNSVVEERSNVKPEKAQKISFWYYGVKW